MNAPHREIFIHIFKSVVALSASRQIIFLCVCTGRLIQLYHPNISVLSHPVPGWRTDIMDVHIQNYIPKLVLY